MRKESKLTLGSLFDGSGGFPLAGLLSGIIPKWCSEIEPFPIAITKARFPYMKHYGDVNKINGAEVEPVDIITFGSPCFPAGVGILTADGVKNIEDVQVGDKVLTHMGRWNRVIDTGSKKAETVILHGDTVDLECTPNHPIYSLIMDGPMDECGRADWVEAKDMACCLYAMPTSVGVTCSYEPIKTDFLHYWYYVRSVEWTHEKKTVYNMTVEDDNSYVADGVVVHNCQDMSVAGKRAGIAGERSGLFFQAIRIIEEMRKATNGIYPTFAVLENVSGIYSSNRGEDFREVLNAFVRVVEPTAPSVPTPEKGWAYADVIMGDGFSIAYRTLDAQYWGVPQRRKRIYLVADFRGQRAGKILFESEGVSGYSAESFSAWQRASSGSERGVGRTGERGVTFQDKADCLYAAYGTKWNGNGAAYNGSLFVNDRGSLCLNDMGGASIGVSDEVVGALRAEMHGHQPCVMDDEQELYNNHHQGADYRGPLQKAPCITAMYGTGGINTPFVLNRNKPTAYGVGAFNSKGMLSDNPKVGFSKADKSRTLDQQGGNPCCNQGGIALVDEDRRPIPFAQNQRNEVRILGDKAGAVMAQAGMKQQTYVCEPTYVMTDGMHTTLGKGQSPCLSARDYKSPNVVAYALQGNMIGREEKNGPQGNGINKDVCFTLNTIDRHGVYALTTGSFLTAEEEKTPTLSARDFHLPVCVSYGIGREAKMAVNEEIQPSMTARGAGLVGFCRKNRLHRIGTVNEGRQGERIYTSDGPSATLSADGGGVGASTGLYLTNATVRRLTPTECARLQGFPDWWTSDIGDSDPSEKKMAFWREIFSVNGKKKSDSQIKKWLKDPSSDSAEYKMWGNGIALPCATFVLAGIAYYAKDNM